MAKQDHYDLMSMDAKPKEYGGHGLYDEPQPDCFHMENKETPMDSLEHIANDPVEPELKREAYNAPWYTRFVIQPLDFCVKNKLGIREHAVIKYICRYPFKGQPLKDLYQARFYIDELIKEHESEKSNV